MSVDKETLNCKVKQITNRLSKFSNTAIRPSTRRSFANKRALEQKE